MRNDKVVRTVKEFSAMPLATYAASAAFFLFVSVLPFFLLLSLLVPRLGVGADQIIGFINAFTPSYVDDLVEQIIRDTFSRSESVVPLSVVIILWSSAMSFGALGDGLRLAYQMPRRFNYIITRLLSVLYVVVLLLLLLAALLLVMFGKHVLSFAGINRIRLPGFLTVMLQGRIMIFLIFGVLLLLLLYTYFSGSPVKPLRHLPGVVFTLVAWLAFSSLFSLYLKLNTTYGMLYGSMSVIVVLMLWLYFCVYILLLGAGINAFLMKRG